MTTIHKKVLNGNPIQDVVLPDGTEILRFGEQHGDVCIWYRFTPSNSTDIRRIALCVTGGGAPDFHEGKYLGTAMLHGGNFVLHAFERISV